MALPVVHYLVYRARVNDIHSVDWEEPDGGVVIYRADKECVRQIAEQRYHCGPREKLVVAEATTQQECWAAVVLSAHWEKARQEFHALMEVA